MNFFVDALVACIEKLKVEERQNAKILHPSVSFPQNLIPPNENNGRPEAMRLHVNLSVHMSSVRNLLPTLGN